MNDGGAKLSTTQPEKAGDVLIALDNLSCIVDNLDNAVSRIGSKTTPICSPSTPVDIKDPCYESNCDISNMINNHTARIQALVGVIQNITDRLEI